ncbi:hypothetical protein BDY21DRAFT_100955 [Lineolata rhizophorae]|uniref:histidine kinase n=1 Tax=Lineolata rhizophorae TaxID=578093 RepID=A0A6A6NT10_9PEZI|nr:hypothetical protein BDY21DRAFT_100955 [Lineolata rhizophorae]
MEASVRSVATRVIIQNALSRYNQGNNTDENWTRSEQDVQAALDGDPDTGLLIQMLIWPKNDTGLAGNEPVLNGTGNKFHGAIQLPYNNSDGSPIFLGDDGPGYPPNLYPNLTYFETPYNETYNVTEARYNGQVLNRESSILIGPWQLNETFSLLSLTLPIVNNTSNIDILGWVTVVMDGRLVENVVRAEEGLESSGVTMIIGPTNITNLFPPGVMYDSPGKPPDDVEVEFKLAPNNTSGRHAGHASITTDQQPFDYADFPAVRKGLTVARNTTNNAGSLIQTNNEEGFNVAVGYAIPRTGLCDWVVLVEQDHDEVWAPIRDLRNILIACVCGTAGGALILAFPIAHYSSRPIRRLREATRKSFIPTELDGSADDDSFRGSLGSGSVDGDEPELARKEGLFQTLTRWRTSSQKRRRTARRDEERRRHNFRIPGKVKDRKHIIHDELTDLTTTFNEMVDELMMQYEKLEERVAQRTAELELSKKAAEAANESKTLFIANISHELKTPLNGILGMCAVCMGEQDPDKLKRSLGIIYKSGDLLLNLLTDLLTFSKNQVGQQLPLDEREFKLRDVSTQLLAIFDKQAKESGISLLVAFEGAVIDAGGAVADAPSERPAERSEYAPFGVGRVKDLILWGDQHRILQVVINLVSNSLKFTPIGGTVKVTIRCTGEADDKASSRKSSLQSKQSRQQSVVPSRNRSNRVGSGSDSSLGTGRGTSTPKHLETANEINAVDKPVFAHVMNSERSASPPPGRMLCFEFEVEDTGPGIPDHLQQRIFEPFVQGDLGLSKKFGGTGLGLSICSQLASLMRGSISLKSEEGRGSTFTMRIPLRHLQTRADSTASSSVANLEGSRRNSAEEGAESKVKNGEDAAVVASGSTSQIQPSSSSAQATPFSRDSQPRLIGLRQPFFASNAPLESPNSQMSAMERVEHVTTEVTKRGDKVRVLVAEDNKTNQEVVLRMLKLEDIYDVTVAKDGQEALDLVKESMKTSKPYNLIFMDVQMPKLDGLQSTRLIRQSGFSAPIVALTAYAEESNVKECLDSGMNYFLSKPIRRPALKQVLKTYCPPIPEVEEAEHEPPASPKSGAAIGSSGGKRKVKKAATAPVSGSSVGAGNASAVPDKAPATDDDAQTDAAKQPMNGGASPPQGPKSSPPSPPMQATAALTASPMLQPVTLQKQMVEEEAEGRGGDGGGASPPAEPLA